VEGDSQGSRRLQFDNAPGKDGRESKEALEIYRVVVTLRLLCSKDRTTRTRAALN
jgi:hypothetical protein